MALSNRDRIGLILLIGLFCVFGLLLYVTVQRPDRPGRDFQNNVIIQQRMKNVQNQ